MTDNQTTMAMGCTTASGLLHYETPSTRKIQVEMEEGICVTSGEKVESIKMEVEVDDWNSIDNEVTFE